MHQENVPDVPHSKKLTHEFEKNVINSIGDPNEG